MFIKQTKIKQKKLILNLLKGKNAENVIKKPENYGAGWEGRREGGRDGIQNEKCLRIQP